MSEPEWPLARILNLPICTAISAWFVAALAGADPRLLWPHGSLEHVLFWVGGPCAIMLLAVEAFVSWSTWADDRHVRRHRDEGAPGEREEQP
jgi:hypothetical protein